MSKKKKKRTKKTKDGRKQVEISLIEPQQIKVSRPAGEAEAEAGVPETDLHLRRAIFSMDIDVLKKALNAAIGFPMNTNVLDVSLYHKGKVLVFAVEHPALPLVDKDAPLPMVKPTSTMFWSWELPKELEQEKEAGDTEEPGIVVEESLQAQKETGDGLA